ncbi:SRPBCC family protein [Actinoplanes sp. NPDC023801]|uniref:SRPBCC family protein n=1 Tax=Actinoplanes sp. NPDC023801 TaxID=3154595 RepID=UPI00340F82A5
MQIPIDRAWQVLTDLEGIAPCMPGAQLTGVDGEVYKGKVKVKVGPVISEFAGTAQFTAKDDTTYRAVIDAKGRDARSAGNAAAVVSASLVAEGPSSTRVSVDTDLKISGKLAQFGSGMIKEVSSKLLAQFVANLEAKLAVDTASAAASAPASAPAATLAESPASPSSAAVSVPGAPASIPSGTAASGSAASSSASPGSAVPASVGAGSAVPASAVSSSAAPVSGVSAAAVETAPDSAVALGVPAPAGPVTDDAAAPAIAPDPSAGEIEPAAGRLETAEGTPEPVAPLRVPGADLSAAPTIVAEAASPTGGSAAAAPTGGSATVASTEGTAAGPGDGSAASGAGAAKPGRVIESEEPEALDLLAVAGGSIYKRVIPVAVGAAAIAAAVIVWFVARG